MADTTTSVLTKPIRALYNAAALQSFVEAGQFWKSATIREAALGESKGKGKSVVFDIWTAGAISTSPLSEDADGTATSLALDQVEVTLQEYGNYVKTTRKLRETHYGEAEEHAAWMMGQMANDTLDMVARDALDAQTGATWSGYAGEADSVSTITIGSKLTADDVRKAFAKLRGNKAPSIDGYYLCYVHPHVLKDLKEETGDGSWTKAALYADAIREPIRDEVGIFEGFRFVMSTSCKLDVKAGAGTTTSATSADVYSTYFVGQDALGFARSGNVPEINVSEPVTGPVDAFRRFQVISWYALCGFKALRDEALFKVFASSSLAANGS